MAKHGVLLINLGTPDNCDPASVYRYLTEFLNDPRVIDLPVFLRWPLVNLIIVPFRYKKAAHAYQKIWGDSGSPLLKNSQSLQQALADELGPDYQVELGMRYGNPTISTALNNLQASDDITILPLFPQYSSAATGSALQQSVGMLTKAWNFPALKIKNDFYNDPGFIAAYAEMIQQNLNDKKIDLLLFSYHGLPLRHINKSECKASCDHLHACPPISDLNRYCYRAQCYKTSQLLAAAINLETHQYQVAFQSRLGRTPWIKPYTDLVLPELIQAGVKNLAVVCPSFVADCLETLEEVNIRAREQWQMLGGETFTFIPCLNAEPLWVNALAAMIRG